MKTIALPRFHITFFTFFSNFFAKKISLPTLSQSRSSKLLAPQVETAFAQLSSISTSSQFQQNFSEDFSRHEFLSAITHELKTPLSAIISMSEMLAENFAAMNVPQNSELLAESKSFVTDITTITSDMLSLVHDILDVSNNSSGKFSVDLNSEIDICDVMRRAVKLNYDYSLKRNVAIKVTISDEIGLVKLDEKRMKQVLTNLISNAVKYSPAGSEVRISAKIKNNYLEISVADQGFGMTEAQIKTAFQKYQTIANQNSGIVDSFGLGLPITKQLVELQNGTIKMKSEIGKGTNVVLTFPLISEVKTF